MHPSIRTVTIIVTTIMHFMITVVHCRDLHSLSPSSSSSPTSLRFQYSDIKTLKTSILSTTTTTSVILGAANYVSLFLWNDLKYSSLSEVYESLSSKRPLRFFSYTFQPDAQRHIMTRVIPRSFLSLSFNSSTTTNNISEESLTTGLWTYSQVSLGASTDCLYGSVFEHFDILIDTPDVFAKRLRFASSHFGRRKPFQSGLLNPNDFQHIPLFPSMVWIYNGSLIELEDISTNHFMTTSMMTVLKQNSTLTNLTCLDSVIHDARVFERLHGIANFTEQDLHALTLFMNISTTLNYTFEIINKAFTTISMEITTTTTTWTKQQVRNNLWPSSCFYCSTSGCVAERWAQQDYLDISVASVGIFFYLILFSSKAFLHPSIKRKFGNAYLGPFLIMVGFAVNSPALANHCSTGAGLVFSYCIFTLSLVYICTMLRFYYLRNIYWIIDKTDCVKIHKVLSTLPVGIIITIFVPLILAAILTIPHIVLVRTFNSTTINLNFNLMVLGMALIPSILGSLVVAFDIVKHRKSIKEKGLRRFLFFEDPFFVRVDLISLNIIVIFMVAVLLSVGTSSNNLVPIFRFICGLCGYLVCGGANIIVILVQHLLFRASSLEKQAQSEHDQFDFHHLMESNNESFYKLFKEYCSGESSTENILLFETLKKLKDQQSLTLNDMHYISKTFLNMYSLYEVNIPSSVRADFGKAIKDHEASTLTTIHISVIEPLYIEVMANLKDTFRRLEKTSVFAKWKHFYQVQKVQSVI
ncbi:hypothetical protein C9374_004909 [Naegleria lovaniensis]|uniref:RGS domain-containing protein n=1 Tax=Naegleria lovaniensis TaxID=51637 RepID=A0AA88GRD9_NAELO|nr:uncharacterized protein C9374_004909 [Naegleria lovaniensis]KAG2382942.1 hypothetical protein C9374_004909 [Naegleria lovaniensis]